MVFEYFVNDLEENGVQMPKAEFVRKVCQELMENEEWVAQKRPAVASEKAVCASPSDEATDVEVEEEESRCETKTIPAGYYKWDPVMQEFPVAMTSNGNKNMYQKYCFHGRLDNDEPCQKRVRTFCDFNPSQILCYGCIVTNRMVLSENGHN